MGNIGSNINNRPKLGIKQQIAFLKYGGVKFEICDESMAQGFLQKNSYFFKINSYSKNYEFSAGKYKDLDFAYLVDLSIIDMHFRRIVLRLVLDIEHILRTKLINDFNYSREDGYSVVQDFLAQHPRTKIFIVNRLKEINKNPNKHLSFSDSILREHQLDLAIWNFIEVVHGDLIYFCKFFYNRNTNKQFNKIKDSLFNVLSLRNSAAHNNCLLSNLCEMDIQAQRETASTLNNILPNMRERQISKHLKNHTINDFCTSLIVFEKICKSTKMKIHFYKDFLDFLENRVVRHKEYYQNNEILKGRYRFVREITLCLLNRNRMKCNV